MNKDSLVIWLRFGGLLASAWVVGDGYAWLVSSGSPLYDEPSWLAWLIGPAPFYAPIALAMLWVWSPLERSGTVSAAALLAGVVLTYHFSSGVPDPGPDGLEDTRFVVMFVGTVLYAMYAGLAWLTLWLIGRKLERF